MKRTVFTVVLSALICISGFGCTPTPAAEPAQDEAPAYSIQGTWEYVLYTELDGSSNEYDLGTITFTGDESAGNVSLLNFYEIEYPGTYIVSGSEVTIQMDQVWTGRFTDEQHLAGTGTAADEEAGGEWEAVRR